MSQGPRNTKIGEKVVHLTRSKVKVARSRDACDRFAQYVENVPKLVEGLPKSRAIMRTSFKVIGQRSSTRLTNAETGSVYHIFRTERPSYELQAWYTDGVRRPISPTSAMTINVKGEGRDVTTWCV